jgi:aminoglycoside 3-N-acetyltransferase
MTDSDRMYDQLISNFILRPDDTVFLSSDLGKVAAYFKRKGQRFDANAFIEKVQAHLSEGTLIIPAYTDNLRDGDTFDRQYSKPTTGALSNRVFKRKDFHRTSDPLHSVFVWGSKASELIAMKDESTFGANSVFGFLERNNAIMLIIDVHFNNSFTFVHFIEQRLNVKFRKAYYWKIMVADEEKTYEKNLIFHTKKMGVVTDLDQLQQFLIEKDCVLVKDFENIPILRIDLKNASIWTETFIKKIGKTYRFDPVLWLKQLVKKMIGRKY